MGNRPTVSECFDRLGVSVPSQKPFRQDVLDFLREQTQQDFTGLGREKLMPLVKEYLRSHNFKRWRPEGTPNDSAMQESLIHLINMWADDKRKKESQEDPPWHNTSQAARPRKRRRTELLHQPDQQPDQQPTTLVASPIRQHAAGPPSTPQVRSQQRSSVLLDDSDLESLQDIPHSVSSEASLPEVADIVRSSRQGSPEHTDWAETHTPSKAVSRTNMRQSARDAKAHAHTATTDSLNLSGEELNLTDSPQNPVPRLAAAPHVSGHASLDSQDGEEYCRRSHSMLDMENGGEASPTMRGTSHATGTLAALTPPPTTRKSQKQKVETQSSIEAGDTVSCELRQVQSVRKLLNDIVDYIDACERHNIHTAHSISSSEKETQLCRIRAAAFASLKRDVESRIDAALGASDRKEILPVTSYCLWS